MTLNSTTSISILFNSTLNEGLINSSSNRSNIIVPDYILYGQYVAVVITFISAYVFASLLAYTLQNWNQRNVSKINHLTVVCAFCSLLLSLMKSAEQWTGLFSCTTVHWIETCVYVVGTVLSYTVLWARQRKLYSDERLAMYVSKPMRLASSVMIVVIYLTISATSFIFATRYEFKQNEYPCILEWKELNTLYPGTITFMVACFFFQFLLFYFLLYPLTRSRTEQTKRNCFLCFQPETSSERTAKRLALCLGACISSSTLLSLTVLLDTFPSIQIHWCNFAAMDLLTNTVATTCALVNWKNRLFSLFIIRKEPETQVSKLKVSDTL